jgi:hypothetical protein
MVEDNLISLQVEKEITSLFKYYLEILEELEPDQEKYAVLRKKVLGHSNDSIRQLIQFLDYFDFQVNKEKVEKYYKERVTHKKIIIGSLISIE